MKEDHDDTNPTTSESPQKAVLRPEFEAATRYKSDIVKQGENRDEQELKRIASKVSDFEV